MFRLFDIFLLTLERLWQHRTLVMWVLLGLVAATTLSLSLMLYVDAVNSDLLEASLEEPAFAYRFRYLGAWNGNIGRADVESATATVRRTFANTIGLPPELAVDFVRTVDMPVQLRPPDDQPLTLGNYSLGSLAGNEGLLFITDGAWPPNADAPDSGTVPVLVSETMLFSMGVEVGDQIVAQPRGGQRITMEVAALWRPVNPDDPRWIFVPRFFNEIILVPPDDLWPLLEGVEDPIEESAWYTIFDGDTVRTSDAGPLLNRTTTGVRSVENALPGVRLDLAPEDGLRDFITEVNQLVQQLVIVLLPVAGMVLYFVSLVAGLLVSRQQSEDVMLRSRGMSRAANLSIHTLMWLILAGLAFGAGLLAAPYVVALVGRTSSFLQFDGVGDPLAVVFTRQALLAGGITSLLAASTGLVLAYRNTFRTINQFKQQSARATRAWWQRIYLDVLLLIPGGYVLYTLSQQGGLVSAASDPFSDPLTFVGPALFALGTTLLFLRVWPLLVRGLAGVIRLSANITLLMALRELTRSIGRYRGTLLMMCFTLSLTGFTASMANTIDRSLVDTINYQVGAEVVIVTAAETLTEEGEINQETGEQEVTITGFNILPADDLLDIDGVAQVSRVGRYPARLLTGRGVDGVIVGVDRAAMAEITRFRPDFAPEPAADLFNRLAEDRTGVIIDLNTLEAEGLALGQEVQIEIEALGEVFETRVPVVGVTEYFPTLDPTEGFYMIGNILPIFEVVGTPLPHDIWLTLDPGADTSAVQAAIREQGFPVVAWRSATDALQRAQAEPSRRGVLGFLSVGFVASTLLTLIAAIIQSSASFRAQASQLGALRAMGLSGVSVGAYLVLLQGIATISGVAGGTAIGVATTLLYLPLLDFSGGLPPYLVRIAWDQLVLVYAIFAGVLLLVTLLTTFIVTREQLSTVTRLGDV